jgi:hypothetical protein
VIEKKKRLAGLRIPKRRLSFVFSVGRKGKENVLFFTSRLIFYNTRLQRPHRKWEKEIYTIFRHFLNFVFPFWKHRI